MYHETRQNISYESISYMSTLYQINSNSPGRRVSWLLNRLFSSTIRSWVRQSGFLTTTITPSHAATFSTRFWCTAAHRSYYKLPNYLHNFFNTSDASELLSYNSFNRFSNDVTIVVTGDDPSHVYTLCLKKTWCCIFAITSSNVNRFRKIFHCWKEQ